MKVSLGKKTKEVQAQRIIRASALTQGWEQLRGSCPGSEGQQRKLLAELTELHRVVSLREAKILV